MFNVVSKTSRVALVALTLLSSSAPTSARVLFDEGTLYSVKGTAPFLQCVPYARWLSGIHIFGDARTWWNQADGRYARGTHPAPGAVMAFKPYGGMRLGHVAIVSRIINPRTVLLRHANWSPINGRRGQIELDVQAMDVSPANNWSAVRVWFNPIGSLGSTAWPVQGFIYNSPITRSQELKSPAGQVAPQVQLPATPQVRYSPTGAPAAATGWHVQLGAFAVRVNADRLWNKLQSRPELVGHLQPAIQAGRVTKLQAGGFTNADAAREACRRLASAQIVCIVSR